MNMETFLATVLGFEIPLHTQAVFNPSVFTFEKFGIREGTTMDISSLDKGLNVALALNLLFSGALYVGMKSKIPSIVAGLTTLGTYAYYKTLLVTGVQKKQFDNSDKMNHDTLIQVD